IVGRVLIQMHAATNRLTQQILHEPKILFSLVSNLIDANRVKNLEERHLAKASDDVLQQFLADKVSFFRANEIWMRIEHLFQKRRSRAWKAGQECRSANLKMRQRIAPSSKVVA